MNNILFNYIIQAILGGASGYITNDYAINMLFKEYTPLKIGGVIKKTRNEFIDNLSNLMEEDIINKDKLKSVMSEDKFKHNFEKLTEDFFTNCLYQSVGSQTFKNIPSIDTSLKTTKEFIVKILDDSLAPFIDTMLSSIKLEDILTDGQLNSLFDNIMISSIETLENTTVFEDVVSSMYTYNKNLKLTDIVGDRSDKVLDIIRYCMNELNITLKNNFNTKIDAFIKNLALSSGLKSALVECKNILFTKKFRDLLSLDDKFLQNTANNLKIYTNSEAGQNSLHELCATLFGYVKKTDKTLFDIADSTMEIKLKSYLEKNLPKFTSALVVWILINKNDIESMIESAVDEVISESDGMKGKLLNTLRSSILNNISQKYKIVDKIATYVNVEMQPQKLSHEISSKIMNYLENTSIRDIVISAEDNNILTADKTTQYITNYINEYSEVIVTEISELILNSEADNILSDNMSVMGMVNSKIITILKDKILSSQSITTSLSSKICEYATKTLNTEIYNIIGEKSLDEKSCEMKITLLEMLRKNSCAIKSTCMDEIKTVISGKTIKHFVSKVTTDNISNLLSKEIQSKFNQFTSDIKDVNLSFAVEKINSIDNLYKNSSENLGNLIASNMDSVMSNSVKKIVSSNLNKLDDDQLCDMANEFIGKELKPIMYFGGILGTAAGVGLAAIQNSAPNLNAISFANMATYALVGFATNAIAINMIFKPYKEVKILSKIPFLRNFALGYIVKNQPLFASNMANVINKNLLNNDSINELFNQYEEAIKSDFTKSITNNNYMVFQNLLLKNHNDIVSACFKFTENLVNGNIYKLAHFGVDKLGNINIDDIITTENIYYLSYLASKNTNVMIDKFAPYLFSKLEDNISINGNLPKFIPLYIKNKILAVVTDNYDKIVLELGNIDSVKKFLMPYDNKYQTLIDKPLENIIDINTFNNVKSLISSEAGEMILSKNIRQQISSVVIKMIDSKLDGDKLFEDIFDGKIKNFIDDKLYSYFEKISYDLKDSLKGLKDSIADTVKAEVKANLGFLEKSMYSMMGGDSVVDDIVTRIVLVKIPVFIDLKKQEILDIFSNLIDDRLYKVKLKDLQISASNIRISNMIDDLFDDEENRDMIRTQIKDIVCNISVSFSHIKLKDILKVLSAESIENIFARYDGEISSLLHTLSRNLTDNKKEIIDNFLLLSCEIADNFFSNLSLKGVFKDISATDINIVLENALSIVNKDDKLKTVFCDILNKYKEHLGQEKTITNFMNTIELESSFSHILEDIIVNEDVKVYIKDLCSSILSEVHDNNLGFIDDQTKNYFINMLIDTGMNSIKRNLQGLLKSIDFDKIAREEILDMKPEKIHQMFNSFAGKYFGRLMIYGFGGFVFGINVYLGLFLTALKAITSVSKKHLGKDK